MPFPRTEIPGRLQMQLADRGIRMTAQRRAILSVIETASKHLDEFAFLDGQRPFSYRNLMVVAFIQNDETKEVLHAVEAAIK